MNQRTILLTCCCEGQPIMPCLLIRRWCFGLKTWPETMSLDYLCCSWEEAFSCRWMMGLVSKLSGWATPPTLVHSDCCHQKTGTDKTSPSPPPVQLWYSGTSPSRPSAQPCYWWTSPLHPLYSYVLPGNFFSMKSGLTAVQILWSWPLHAQLFSGKISLPFTNL